MSRTSVLTAGTALLCTLLICSCSVTKKMQEQLKELPFPAVDMAHVKDGTYTGMAETLLVQADVSVEIIGGHIRQIKILRHINGKGKKAETIVNTMKAANTWDVDCVSGATASSLVLKSATAQAIAKGVAE
jgi:uncharacterized protein with FMN-binding domain